MRAVRAYLAALAGGETVPSMTVKPPTLAAFVATLSSAWHAGEVLTTFSIETKPRYLRSLQKVTTPAQVSCPAITKSMPSSAPVPVSPKMDAKPQPIYAERGNARAQSLRMVWPIVCRRLEGLPNISATQLFEELCIQFPGRFTRRQYHATSTCQSLA
jgi:hypothetical protein